MVKNLELAPKMYTPETKVTELSRKDQVDLYIFLVRDAGFTIDWLSLEDKFDHRHNQAFNQWSQTSLILGTWLSQSRLDRWLNALWYTQLKQKLEN